MNDVKKLDIYLPLILLLLGSFLLFSIWSAFQAVGLGSAVTDADYYSKGLRYNNTMVEKQAATVLGWSLSTRLDGRTLEFGLTNRDGTPVTRATGSLYLAIPNTAENINLPLHEIAAGRYIIELNDRLTGAIQARLDLGLDGARLHRQLLLNF
ncbi:MAG: FixH family protein [Desulfuromonadales bacterium]|nr:FixH family protein [Desulfuromonadales bacterium]